MKFRRIKRVYKCDTCKDKHRLYVDFGTWVPCYKCQYPPISESDYI